MTSLTNKQTRYSENDSLQSSCKHKRKDVAETGLNLLNTLEKQRSNSSFNDTDPASKTRPPILLIAAQITAQS